MTKKPKTYPSFINNPLINFVFKVQISPVDYDPNTLTSLHEKCKEKFPKKRPLYSRAFENLKSEKSKTVSKMPRIIGYELSSEDEKNIFTLFFDEFSFETRGFYDSWEKHLPDIRNCCSIYKKFFDPKVTHVSLRYINKIEIPRDKKISDYLSAEIYVSKNHFEKSDEFFLRMVPKREKKNDGFVKSLIFLGMPDSSKETESKGKKIFFDISTFYSINGNKLFQDIDLEEILKVLHEKAEQIFMDTITDKAKEVFNESIN